MKVCVLLSAYNGERYLEEQLESLIKQKGVEVSVLVRDDGSSDRTREILDKWKGKGVLEWYSGANKGFAQSFMDLLVHSGEYDYYAFCDQDDIWMPDKLANAVNRLGQLESNVKLYCSNTLYYRNGGNMGPIRKSVPEYNVYTSMVQNIAIGCTIVFNRALKDIMVKHLPVDIIAHDYWAYQTAMIFGEVYYDHNSYILYRQHDNNQIGAKTGMKEKWTRRYRSFSRKDRKDSREMQAKELLRCYDGQLAKDKLEAVSSVAGYRDSIFSRMRLFFDGRYTMGHFVNNILLRIRIVFGKL